MTSRHRRAPSALPNLGYDDQFDSPSDLIPSMPLSKYQIPSKDSKQVTKSSTNGKFSHNVSTPNLIDYQKLEQSSNESSFKGSFRQEICEKIEILSDIEPEDPLDELNEAIDSILKARKVKLGKVNSMRKCIKRQLNVVFKGELSDVDTDRRRDNNKCSEDTIEGPGSSFNMDDFSLVKFDASIEHVEKRRKIVKFKEN